MKLYLLAISSILLFGMRPVQAQEIQSFYTDLTNKKCKVTPPTEEEANEEYGGSMECAGPAGYTLIIDEVDARENMTIEHSGKSQDLHLGGVTEHLNYLGDKAEWRMNGPRPIAMIVRMHMHTGTDPKPFEQKLIVVKISQEKSCVVGWVNASKEPNANALARTLADKAPAKPCLW